ncbi:LysR family transcriptional regulator [Maritimibacter sp. 55A14]|uniref:LysR family transcriptional regulator n=1 Tax=Maritimibacter sp. 55A14 TaxID=2174844 RepID=UPI000D614368|nr:LysR family transcriptional regulator [Maritimibacter sp. 55A14]PWE32870.1 LysR family transcriptional regulator [Maritimibacter sp. 55A14]
MQWSISEIETFLLVMDVGSISGAAIRADVSKSVVSKRISDFEASVGTALFTRHAGRITPTDAAISLAERLRPALAELVAATESVASGDAALRGRLTISAPMSFGIQHLGPIIAEFACAHPELEVVLEYDDAITDLARAGFDVGIRLGEMDDSTLVTRKLCEDRRAIVASPDYLERHGPLSKPAQLSNHATICYLNKRIGEIWRLDQPVSPPKPSRLTTNNGEAMRDLVIAGLGIALLPMFIVHEEIKKGRLVPVLPELRPNALPINVVWPPVKPMPRKLRLFIDHLVERFGETPPWLQE